MFFREHALPVSSQTNSSRRRTIGSPPRSARRDTDRSRDMTDDYMAMDPLPRIESEMSRRWIAV